MDIIVAIESYIEGKPEWQKIAELNLENPEDWKFQETIHLTKQKAVTPSLDLMQWVVLMISKQPLCVNHRNFYIPLQRVVLQTIITDNYVAVTLY